MLRRSAVFFVTFWDPCGREHGAVRTVIMARVTARFSRTHWPGALRPYQATTLERLDTAWAGGRRRAWAVLPPGAGKTLIGLEAARRLGRKVVVLVPNTAIQDQWIAHWRRFTPVTATADTDRSLGADVTVLTYQSLAVFDPDAETDEEGRARGPMRRLHVNGRELVERLADAGPLTLVLDECHHLLDVWGRLVAEVLKRLPDAIVLGLTGTPPESLSPDEAALVDTLFGTPILGASAPALVREGHLAPYAELAWLTPPTAVEADHIAGETERFAELTTDLVASTGFLAWLDARFVANTDTVPWARVERDEPRLAAAALRMHHAGLLGLPPGARVREEHRHAPSADDWVALLDDYVGNGAPGSDTVEAIRRALPSVGYTLTRRGVRAARSPVDRVLARSAAKTHATVEIAAAEGAALGDRLRALVLCDHERAGARLPARLRGVLEPEAGSAWLVLANLVADERTAPLGPMLVTGRTVAAGPATARAFLAWANRPDLSLTEDGGVHLIGGSWSARTWVRLVTAFFEEGHCRILIGTRALLGEGWDARGVNALIDLTSATTTTSVVQTRGRALRLDPSWPEKVANVWTVVCVADGHPKGAADWQRFVRKHRGYLAAAPDGEIVSGVAHVDAAFSPYAPPAPGGFDAVNAAMLTRAAAREETRAAWRLGTGFRDELVHTLRVRAVRTATARVPTETVRPEPPQVVPASTCAAPAPPRPVRAGVALALAGGGVAVLLLTVLTWVAALLGLPLLAAGAALGVRRARALRRAERLLEEAAAEPPLLRYACAVADGLLAADLSRRGAEGVVARAEPDGSYRFSLTAVDTATSERFALALDEVLSPVAAPRYVMPRYVLRSAPARQWLAGTARADGVVYHAVPAILGQNRTRATAFARAWNTWISAGEPVYANTPEGEGVLATHRGENPLSATTVLRVAWE
jgi:superfamily II DNA or RNA helicase